MPIRRELLATTALITFGAVWVVNPAIAADVAGGGGWLAAPSGREPAVSELNYSIEAFGGLRDGKTSRRSWGDDVFGVSGKLSVPLGQQYGLQIDGYGGGWGGDGFVGAGGHLFWRDPSVGLAGLYVNHMYIDRGPWNFLNQGSGVNVTKVMGEFEYYWSPEITLRAALGWEGGEVKDRFTAKSDVLYYATPDWKLGFGHRYTGGDNAFAISTEYLTDWTFGGPGNRASLYLEGRIGEDDFKGIWGGIRFYFGPSQTLVDKHRRDDPFDWLPDNLFTLQNEISNRDQNNVAPPAPTVTPGDDADDCDDGDDGDDSDHSCE